MERITKIAPDDPLGISEDDLPVGITDSEIVTIWNSVAQADLTLDSAILAFGRKVEAKSNSLRIVGKTNEDRA